MSKYDFKGIKSKGAKAIELLLGASWAPFAAAMKLPVIGTLIDGGLQLLTNWLANNGLVVLNIGTIIVDGEFDQKGFDDAMDAALASVGTNRDQLSDAQKKAIDDKVIAAFRKFAPFNTSD